MAKGGSGMRILFALFLLMGFGVAADAQVLRPGDTIEIQVWQDPKLDKRMIIPPGGSIQVPLAGQIRAAGLEPAALANVLKSRWQKNYNEPIDVTVSIAAVYKPEKNDDYAPRIYVTGEVLKPGQYLMKVRTNVMQGIALAGGFGPFAAKSVIQIRRKIDGQDDFHVFNYYHYMSGADVSRNIELKNGDVIIVPERSLFVY
jgi:polysaccharide export outer membrane protein